MPYAIDWSYSFVPAVTLWLSGSDPYTAVFFNPPWLLPILAPFVLLGDIGRVLYLFCAIAAFGFIAYRLGGKPLALAAFLVSPFVFDSLAWGNVEWIAALGFVIPGPVGLLLLAVKPQMTFAVILWHIFESWQGRGWCGVLHLCAVPAVVTLLSFVMFGPWFLGMLTYTPTLGLSLFPWSVPIGVYLVAASLRYRRIHYAVAASPLLIPFATPQVWLVTFLALAPDAPALVLSSLVYWGVVVTAALPVP